VNEVLENCVELFLNIAYCYAILIGVRKAQTIKIGTMRWYQ